MLYFSILFSALLLLVEASSEIFWIRHKMSGALLSVDPSDYTVHTMRTAYAESLWYFEIVDGEWGYLTNNYYEEHMSPSSRSMSPSEDTEVRLWSGDHPYQRFALDQVNNRIIHYGGKYLHPVGDTAEPADYTPIHLFGNVNDMMEFEFIDPWSPDEIFLPYGDATISGDWVLVFSVENPLATHTYKVEVSIGKSVSESTSSSFQFVWEASAGAQAWFAQMSTSTSLTNQIEQSSSQTWTTEVVETYEITVIAGQPVATWQKHFYGEQLGHKALHQSNMFHDTEGPHIKPGDDVDAGYYFI